MTSAQRRRVREVFEALVEAAPDDLDSRLASLVPDDDAVQAEVRSLLQHHARAGGFLESPAEWTEEPDAPPLAPGTTLGPYTVVQEVGRGGMGRVYLATDVRLQRRVCLKALRSDPGNRAYRERLQREARLAASLTHPGICAVYALEEFDGHLFLVTEFIEGRTLREEIASGTRPPAAHVVATMRELAAAIGVAHAKGITHRDVKPENIMRTRDRRLKVLDFGVARADTQGPGLRTPSSTLPGALIGTPAYMSPEQLNGGPVGAASDVFSLGIVIYEFASGEHPFAAATGLGMAAHIVGASPRPLQEIRPDLPAPVITAVERCLSKRPSERFASAAEINAALDASASAAQPAATRAWWRLHQAVAVVLYIVAAGVVWQIKEWEPSTAARWTFLLVGACAAINGTVRGHLLFTDAAHPRRLAAERRRTRALTTAADLVIAALLLVGATTIAQGRPVVAVLVMGLAVGLGTAAIVIEPSTSRAAFDVP